jgi:hypothetical protein
MTQSWIQAHERFLLVFAGIVVVFVLSWGWLNKHYELAKAQVAADQQVLDNQKKINQQLQDGYAALQKQTDALNDTLQTQNMQLASQTAAALKAVSDQQKADAAMTNAQLAKRLGDLTNQQNIQSTATGVDLNHDQTVGVDQTLEDVPALKQEIADDVQQLSNDDQQINNLTDTGKSASLLIAGLNQQLTDQQNTCNAQIKKLKISGIKSRLKWFGAGAIVGFIGKIFVP